MSTVSTKFKGGYFERGSCPPLYTGKTMTDIVWNSSHDMHVIPEGEHALHYFDIMCGCVPKYNLDDDNIVREVFHTSFMGEIPSDRLHNVRQTKDC